MILCFDYLNTDWVCGWDIAPALTTRADRQLAVLVPVEVDDDDSD